MSSVDRAVIEERMRSLADEDLQRLVACETDDWSSEALETARAECSKRGVPFLSEAEFLDQHPQQRIGESGFCRACEDETTDGSLLHPVVLMLFGVRVIQERERCAVCRSYVARLWWPLVPIVPLGRYRIIHEGAGPTTAGFLARRLLPGARRREP